MKKECLGTKMLKKKVIPENNSGRGFCYCLFIAEMYGGNREGDLNETRWRFTSNVSANFLYHAGTSDVSSSFFVQRRTILYPVVATRILISGLM